MATRSSKIHYRDGIRSSVSWHELNNGVLTFGLDTKYDPEDEGNHEGLFASFIFGIFQIMKETMRAGFRRIRKPLTMSILLMAFTMCTILIGMAISLYTITVLVLFAFGYMSWITIISTEVIMFLFGVGPYLLLTICRLCVSSIS
jgi:hypothetical protein